MKELVETIAKALVDSPDEVVVTESETERVTCCPGRYGKSNWKAGKNCKSNPFCC